MNALLITNIPTPYRIPLLNEVYRQLLLHSISLTVVFAAKGYSRRKWDIDLSECKFEYIILKSRHITFFNKEKAIFTYPGIFRVMREKTPAIIISNAFSIATTKIWLRSFFMKSLPILIWSGAINDKRSFIGYFRRIHRRLLCLRMAGFITYGTLASKYLVSLGVPENKIAVSFNTVDTDFFVRETAQRKQENNKNDNKITMLNIGYLSKRKGVHQLLPIVKKISEYRNDFKLHIVGDGSEKVKLERLAKTMGVEDKVIFNGFQQKKDLPQFLAKANCLLFPTNYDIWGLVLVEAMSVGLTCFASDKAGATHDLISHGYTGYRVDFTKTEDAAALIDSVISRPEKLKEIGANAARLIQSQFSITQSATAMATKIFQVVEEYLK